MPDDIPEYNPGIADDLFLDRDPDHGGVGCIFSGKPGCGKTNGIVKIALYNMERYGDIILWRGIDNCQWTRFNGEKDVVIWADTDLDIINVGDRETGESIDLRSRVEEVKRFKSLREFVEEVQYYDDVINVFYLAPVDRGELLTKKFNELLEELRYRVWEEDKSVSLFSDEFEDIAPLNAGGDRHSDIGDTSTHIKELRKNDVHHFFTAHRETSIDYRVLDKITFSGYMKRANVKKERAPRDLNFKRINQLDDGECLLVNDMYEALEFEWLGDGDNLIMRIKHNPD